MAFKLSDATRNAAANAITAAIDGGSGAGVIEIKSGSAPATPATADSGTLLATCPFSDPSFGAASAGVITASAITADSNVDNSGTAGHFRIKTSAGTVIAQGPCGTSGADLNFNTVTLVAGGTLSIPSFTITVG